MHWLRNPFRQPAPPEPDPPPKGDIFDVGEDAAHAQAAAVNKYLQDLDVDAREQIHMLTEMLDAVVDENNQLKEKILQLQNELDRERQKKLQSP